jgi:Cof subfamily protein (haloacid dehalogenase superfamily)
MTVKLIAIDIDGTLLNSKHDITPEVYKAIQEAKAAGIKVVIATGRPLKGVTKILKDLSLLDDGDYVITYNGALVQATKSGEEFISETLTPEEYLRFEALARELGVHFHANTLDGVYTTNADIGKYTVNEAYLVDMPLYYRDKMTIAAKEIPKAMMIDEPEILDAAIKKLPKDIYDNFNVVKSTPYYLELLNKNASKGIAVTHLAEKLGISHDETMAIGDEMNDLAMLEVVGFPVIMGNGNPDLKVQFPNYITKTNDEDGVAYAIRTWALGSEAQ